MKTKTCKDWVVYQKGNESIVIDIFSFSEVSSHTVFVAFYNLLILDCRQVYLWNVHTENIQVVVA